MKTVTVCPCGNVFSQEKKEFYEIQASVKTFFNMIYTVNQSDILIVWEKCSACENREAKIC